jgi:hypothetical protein
MNSLALLGLAFFAKLNAFFAPVTDDAVGSKSPRRENQRGSRSHRIERFNEINGLGHVRPKNEIDDWLRPADSKQEVTKQNATRRLMSQTEFGRWLA